jgi:ABC-type multidrug transport system ATPase subunit
MQIELKQLQRQLGISFIFVTHDQEEALSMSDRVVVMQEGSVEQVGTPREVYEEPCSLQVAKFIGEVNIFDTKVISADDKYLEVIIEGKQIQLKNRKKYTAKQTLYTLVRPEDLQVWSPSEVTDTTQMFSATVEQVIYKGCTVDLMVRLSSNKLLAATQFFNEDDEYTNNDNNSNNYNEIKCISPHHYELHDINKSSTSKSNSLKNSDSLDSNLFNPENSESKEDLLRRGKVAQSHSLSAFAARYGLGPPLRAISRLMVEGARPRAAPMARMDRPATRPREISSRSGSESANLDRFRGGG